MLPDSRPSSTDDAPRGARKNRHYSLPTAHDDRFAPNGAADGLTILHHTQENKYSISVVDEETKSENGGELGGWKTARLKENYWL